MAAAMAATTAKTGAEIAPMTGARAVAIVITEPIIDTRPPNIIMRGPSTAVIPASASANVTSTDLLRMMNTADNSKVFNVLIKGDVLGSVTSVVDSLKMIAIVTHVADSRSCVLHPASHTHRQMNDQELLEAGVQPDLIRFSVGTENIEDIIADLEQALASI